VHYLSLNRSSFAFISMKIKLPPILYKRGAAWLAFLGAFFFASYRMVNNFSSTRLDVGVMAAAWERHIPFVPQFMLPYMSIDLFFAISLFLFRKRGALDRHALRLWLAMLISMFGFLLFPLKFSFAVPKLAGFNGWLQTALFSLDKPYNQAPSLHISLLIVLWVCYAKKLQGWPRLGLHAWFSAIGVSVLLVYQHHFIDVWTGALVGVACLYLIPDAPFWWRWQPPTARMCSLGLRYALGAGLLLLASLILSKFSGFLTLACIWVASALLLVAAAYYGFGRQVFQRHRGRMRWPARLMLAPYLFGGWLSYLRYTKNKSLPNHILGNVWLGAFPSNDAANNIAFSTILDMTNEFSDPANKAVNTIYLPVMDLTPPSPKILARAVRNLDRAQSKGNVLVHCALGLSRSASVVVCWLIWRGHTTDIQAAIAKVCAQRSGLVLNTEHEKNILIAINHLNGKTSVSKQKDKLGKI
jgi:protein-tyrosine phosphatase